MENNCPPLPPITYNCLLIIIIIITFNLLVHKSTFNISNYTLSDLYRGRSRVNRCYLLSTPAGVYNLHLSILVCNVCN